MRQAKHFIRAGLARSACQVNCAVRQSATRTHRSGCKTAVGIPALKGGEEVKIDGDEHIVFKAPKTDSKKKSQRGRVKVVNNGDSYVDNLYSDSDYSDDVMQTIFKDGKLLVEDNFQTLRERAVEDIREH